MQNIVTHSTTNRPTPTSLSCPPKAANDSTGLSERNYKMLITILIVVIIILILVVLSIISLLIRIGMCCHRQGSQQQMNEASLITEKTT